MSKHMQKILRKAYSRDLGVLCNPYHLFYLIAIKIFGALPQNIARKQQIYLQKLIILWKK